MPIVSSSDGKDSPSRPFAIEAQNIPAPQHSDAETILFAQVSSGQQRNLQLAQKVERLGAGLVLEQLNLRKAARMEHPCHLLNVLHNLMVETTPVTVIDRVEHDDGDALHYPPLHTAKRLESKFI